MQKPRSPRSFLFCLLPRPIPDLQERVRYRQRVHKVSGIEAIKEYCKIRLLFRQDLAGLTQGTDV